MELWLRKKCRQIEDLIEAIKPAYPDIYAHGVWSGTRDWSVYFCPRNGKVLGYYRHDGHGKWDITVYVSIAQAWRVLRDYPAGIASWGPFPRCAVWVFRAKDRHSARLAVEDLCGFD